MDATRFDALSRTVGAQTGRRGMLKAATGGALGLLGLAALGDSAFAKECENNKDCKKDEKCKDKNKHGKGKCKPIDCKNDNQCKNDEYCKNGECKKGCKDNNDCKKGEKCKNNKCKEKN